MGFTVGKLTENEKHQNFKWYVIAIAAAMIKVVGYYIAEVVIYGNPLAPIASNLDFSGTDRCCSSDHSCCYRTTECCSKKNWIKKIELFKKGIDLMYKIMTPGPTQVAENVRLARSRECTNPDLDASFVNFTKKPVKRSSRLLHADNETLILGGEGITGLEAACASMTEPGDHVLVLDNGIYGKGFADFVSMYGGIPELYSEITVKLSMYRTQEFLKEHHNYKYITVVHGDTPKRYAE